jgi:histidinol dehydrogenase
MLRLRYSDRDFAGALAAFSREAAVPASIATAVAAILADVRTGGDAAVARYAAQFDGATLRARDFAVRPAELRAAARRLPAAERRALVAAQAAVAAFNRRNRPRGWTGRNPQGARVGEKFDPIRRVGLYVPGGQVPLVSTVLMTAVLARLAGCPEIAVCTPAPAGGRIADGLLAALELVGITEIYRVGGVQAIGALAYGTATIPAVDKIFGPGNAYVCEAKRQVFGTVGVDSLPGPSELMVIADETARPDFAAADLLAQAEHGSGREKIQLIGTSARVLDAILAEVERQVRTTGRADSVRPVLAGGFLVIEVASAAQAAAVANAAAPEHLQLLVRPAVAKALTKAVTTAGAIMIGNFTPTALGDFVAGPSHVLPTAGAGRFLSGLRVADFLRRTSLVEYDPRSVRRAAPTVAAFAAMERLDAHGRSVEIRTT